MLGKLTIGIDKIEFYQGYYWLSIGLIYFGDNQLDSALISYHNSLKYYKDYLTEYNSDEESFRHIISLANKILNINLSKKNITESISFSNDIDSVISNYNFHSLAVKEELDRYEELKITCLEFNSLIRIYDETLKRIDGLSYIAFDYYVTDSLETAEMMYQSIVTTLEDIKNDVSEKEYLNSLLIENYIKLTEINIRKLDYESANVYANKALSVNDTSTDAMINYGNSCFFIGNEKEALYYYRTVLNSVTSKREKRKLKKKIKYHLHLIVFLPYDKEPDYVLYDKIKKLLEKI